MARPPATRLEDDIASTLASFDLPPRVTGTIESQVGDLRAAHHGWGFPVGSAAPPFSLPDSTGKLIGLRELLARGPVVLTFYRGAWCPICNVQLRAYQGILPDIRRLGAELVAISPQAPEVGREFTAEKELDFTVLSDIDHSVIESYGLLFTPRSDYDRMAIEDFGVDLARENADGTTRLPIPGTFVIDAGGVVRERFVDPDYRNRWEPEAILTALQRLG